MTVHVAWDDVDCTIVRLRFSGRWTWEELQAAGIEAIQMILSRTSRVDFISDMMATSYLPPRYVETIQAMSSQTPPLPNLGLVVLAGPHEAYASFFRRAQGDDTPLEIAQASSLEMAHRLIAQSRRGEPLPITFHHPGGQN
jgi:hypothetical protein